MGNTTNRGHASFLMPFFSGMNDRFGGKWCVLHSYETLPYYSESDVDMAFSGSSLRDLEALIIETASRTGWKLYQKFWYDVQCCCYYVLREKKTGTLLAIDFLTDDHGVGRYGFKTTVLTRNCNLVNDLIPVPDHETALSYKLVKRIEKGRSLSEDEKYLKAHFIKSKEQKITSFLDRQYGTEGKQVILSYLKDNRDLLTDAELVSLKRKRKERIITLKIRTQFTYWESQRILHRIQHPSGMLVHIPKKEKTIMKDFTKVLEQKVDILFRFVELHTDMSWLEKAKAMAGSTLVVHPQSKFDRRKLIWYGWSPKYLALDNQETLDFNDLDEVTDKYLFYILKALSVRISAKLRFHG